MTKMFRLSLVFTGALLFAVGVIVGQQAQRSKFDRYLRPASVTAMEVAMLKANIGVIRSSMSLDVPTIYYDQSCSCFTAHATVTSELTKKPLDEVRDKLMALALIARDAVAFEFPELYKPGTPFPPDHDFKMTFFELNVQKPDASHDFAEYVGGKIVFK